MSLIGYLIRLAVDGGAFLLISRLLPGFTIKKRETAFYMAFVYSIVAGVLGWFAGAFLLSLLISALTMMAAIPVIGLIAGLLLLAVLPVLNLVTSFATAILVLVVTDQLIEDFEMDGMATAVLAAGMLGIISALARGFLKVLLHV